MTKSLNYCSQISKFYFLQVWLILAGKKKIHKPKTPPKSCKRTER